MDGHHAARRRASSTEEGQQAGLVLWSGENPNTFAKIVYINKGATPALRVRRDARRRGRHPGRPDVRRRRRARSYLRVRADGSGRYIAESSLDGEEWVPISEPIDGPRRPGRRSARPQGLRRRGRRHARRGSLYFRVDCSDRIAPTTTASVEPGAAATASTAGTRPPPTVTLTADDGPGAASARSSTRSTAAPLQTYDGPFTLSAPASTRSSTSRPTTPRSRTSSRPRRSASASTRRAEDGRRRWPVRGPGRPGRG